jgi:hypothetical protein
VKKLFKNTTKIFEDNELNRLMIDSLHENDEVIANAITYVYKDKICFVDGTWYFFHDIVWEECSNITNKVILKFITLCDTIKNFIIDSTEIYGVEKREYLEQIHKITENIKNEKKNKKIIVILAENLTRKNTFDQDMNLIAFKNGVYDFEKMEFRQGNSADMIKKSCRYNYSAEYTDKENLVDMLLNIFPDYETLECFLSYLALIMCGRNNLDLLMVLRWTNERYQLILQNLVKNTFGDYCRDIPDLSMITENIEGVSGDISYLKCVRVVIVNKLDSITSDEIAHLIDSKYIDSRNNNINFAILCMCRNEPTIDPDIIQNVGYITTLNTKYENRKVSENDFFLLLLEYLEKFTDAGIFSNIKYVKKDNRPYAEKICCEFMNDCIEMSDGREKCNDVYDRYIEWSNKKGFDTLLSRIGLFAELREHAVYKKGSRFGNIITPAFLDIALLPSKNGPAPLCERKIKDPVKYKIYNVKRIACIGIKGICPYDNKSYGDECDGYCKNCFVHLFPADPRIKTMRFKSKEITVVNHVTNNHDGKWYHDKPLYVNYDNGCCPTRRRIDLRQMFGNTMLCVEIDENQHKYYPEYDDFIRYNEFFCDLSCKYIFIRYNPDEYKINNKITNTNIKIRLSKLSDEINKQIQRINDGDNNDFLEIIHLFYDR